MTCSYIEQSDCSMYMYICLFVTLHLGAHKVPKLLILSINVRKVSRVMGNWMLCAPAVVYVILQHYNAIQYNVHCFLYCVMLGQDVTYETENCTEIERGTKYQRHAHHF